MKALVLLSHGSRLAESNQEMIGLAERMAAFEDHPFDDIVCAFQQFAQPTFEKVVDDLASRDVRHIIVLPLFLAAGSHVRADLPEMIQAIKNRHPHLNVAVTAHLGSVNGLDRFLLDSVCSIEH